MIRQSKILRCIRNAYNVKDSGKQTKMKEGKKTTKWKPKLCRKRETVYLASETEKGGLVFLFHGHNDTRRLGNKKVFRN